MLVIGDTRLTRKNILKSSNSGIRPDPSKRTKHRFPSFRPSDADRIASCTSDENHYDEVYIN